MSCVGCDAFDGARKTCILASHRLDAQRRSRSRHLLHLKCVEQSASHHRSPHSRQWEGSNHLSMSHNS